MSINCFKLAQCPGMIPAERMAQESCQSISQVKQMFGGRATRATFSI